MGQISQAQNAILEIAFLSAGLLHALPVGMPLKAYNWAYLGA